MINTSRTVPQWIKDAKYKFCAVCGQTEDLHYHHFVPTANGGKTEPSNIIVLCASCHQILHDQGGSVRHNYLVKRGIEEARKHGVKVGRKPIDYEKVMQMISQYSTQFNTDSLTTEHEIMAMAGIKEVCYHKCKCMLFDAMSKSEWPYEWPKPVKVRNRPLYDHVIQKMRGGAK